MWGSDYPFVLDHGPYEDSCSALEELLRTKVTSREEKSWEDRAPSVLRSGDSALVRFGFLDTERSPRSMRKR